MKLNSNKHLILIFSLLTINHYAQITNLHSSNLSSTESSDSLANEVANEILLNSSPQDAYVFQNDSLIGNTPIFVQNRITNFTLRKKGYADMNILFDQIKPGQIFPLNFVGFEKEKSFYEKDIFKILTAGIVVLGATTAYFKLEADNKFKEYENSGNNNLLDETRKYDLISGITFAALQINFGLLLYYFLIE